MRFAMTAKTLVRERQTETGVRDITARNVAKVVRYRKDGEEELESLVRKMGKVGLSGGRREGWEGVGGWGVEDARKRRRVEWERKHSRKGVRDPNSGRRVPKVGYEDRELPGLR